MKLRACLYIAGLALFCTSPVRPPAPKDGVVRVTKVPLPVRNPVAVSQVKTVVPSPVKKSVADAAPGAGEKAAEVVPPHRKPGAKVAPTPAPTAQPELKPAPEIELASLPPLPQRKPPKPGPVHPKDVEVPDWTDDDVAAAESECARLLKNVAIEYEAQPPLREGLCGAPAPILVTSIGKNPAIKIGPGAVMTCPLAAGLAKWLDRNVQPAARRHLGAPISRISNISSYVCRNRYNIPGDRISQHAHANALDIAMFEASNGEKIVVLSHWNATIQPPPPLPEQAPENPDVTQTEEAALRHAQRKSGRADGNRRRAAAPPAHIRKQDRVQQASQTVAVELDLTNGKVAAAPPPKPDPKSLFLQEVHGKACATFGTVLGPEANAAHENHFHLDMASRRHRNYCE